MLIFSGLGSLLAGRYEGRDRHSVRAAALAVLAWCGADGRSAASRSCSATPGLAVARSRGARAGCRRRRSRWRSGCRSRSACSQAGPAGLLPWAWGLNGAFSVVATPLANLIAREVGLREGSSRRSHAVWHRRRLRSRLARKNVQWQHLQLRHPPRTDRRRRRTRARARRSADRPRRRRHAGSAGRATPTSAAMRDSGRPVEPDRRAVRRHPGAQAGRDEADRELPEGATSAPPTRR